MTDLCYKIKYVNNYIVSCDSTDRPTHIHIQIIHLSTNKIFDIIREGLKVRKMKRTLTVGSRRPPLLPVLGIQPNIATGGPYILCISGPIGPFYTT